MKARLSHFGRCWGVLHRQPLSKHPSKTKHTAQRRVQILKWDKATASGRTRKSAALWWPKRKLSRLLLEAACGVWLHNYLPMRTCVNTCVYVSTSVCAYTKSMCIIKIRMCVFTFVWVKQINDKCLSSPTTPARALDWLSSHS